MFLTVGICTWNRCELLRQTLEQMTRLAIPPDIEWELLVVNNNCTDATEEVISAFADRLPIRSMFEPQPGQSHARNAAVREASGEYILWTDDDVLVDPAWMAGYCEAFRQWPHASIFGGRIDPWFEGTPPRWLEAAFPCVAGAYATRDLGPDPIPLGHDSYPFGANMAFRAEILRRHPFDASLGLRPGSTLRGEEMVLVRRLLAEGEEGRWVPEARVRHFIPKDRQTVRYLREYSYGGGQLLGRTAEVVEGWGSFLGRPLWLWRQALTAELRYRLLRFVARPESWVADATLASLSWGQLQSYRTPLQDQTQ